MTSFWDLSAADEVIPLAGHSGASILLITRASERRVRKIAKGAAENGRLLRQMDKQRSAHEAGLGTPAILAFGMDGDRAFFDMEYIPSRSVARSIVEGAPPNLDKLGDYLTRVIEYHRAKSGPLIPRRVFEDKLANISSRCGPTLAHLGLSGIFLELVSGVLDGDLEVSSSPSHGDFTFENILIGQNGDFILIDFDDPGFSSWQLDLAKLMQDAWGRWCLRSLLLERPGCVESVNALVELDRVRSTLVTRMLSNFPLSQCDLGRLCLFHLARIIPYCKDDRLILFIMNNAHRILNELVS